MKTENQDILLTPKVEDADGSTKGGEGSIKERGMKVTDD